MVVSSLLFSISFISLIFPFLFEILSDRDSISGRGAIWRVAFTYITDHPWLGAGYTAFWRSGPESPIRLIATSWEVFAAHSHNGYIESVLGLGILGIVLVLFSLFIIPFYAIIKSEFSFRGRILLSWIVFHFLQNLIEAEILQRQNESWAMHAVALALIFHRPVTSQIRTTGND